MCVRGWGGISTCVCVGGGGISTCVCVGGEIGTCVLGWWDRYVHVCVCMSANQSMQLVHVPLSSWHNAVLDNLTKCATIV